MSSNLNLEIPTHPFTAVENFSIVTLTTAHMKEWHHSQKYPILGSLAARVVGCAIMALAVLSDVIIHFFLTIGKGLVALPAKPLGLCVNLPKDLDFASAFIHLKNMVERISQCVPLIFLALLDPDRTAAAAPFDGGIEIKMNELQNHLERLKKLQTEVQQAEPLLEEENVTDETVSYISDTEEDYTAVRKLNFDDSSLKRTPQLTVKKRGFNNLVNSGVSPSKAEKIQSTPLRALRKAIAAQKKFINPADIEKRVVENQDEKILNSKKKHVDELPDGPHFKNFSNYVSEMLNYYRGFKGGTPYKINAEEIYGYVDEAKKEVAETINSPEVIERKLNFYTNLWMHIEKRLENFIEQRKKDRELKVQEHAIREKIALELAIKERERLKSENLKALTFLNVSLEASKEENREKTEKIIQSTLEDKPEITDFGTFNQYLQQLLKDLTSEGEWKALLEKNQDMVQTIRALNSTYFGPYPVIAINTREDFIRALSYLNVEVEATKAINKIRTNEIISLSTDKKVMTIEDLLLQLENLRASIEANEEFDHELLKAFKEVVKQINRGDFLPRGASIPKM